MKLPSILAFLIPCNSTDDLQIIIADNATITEKLTANDLKSDLQKVTDLEIVVVSEKEAKKEGRKILIGTASSNQSMATALSAAKLSLTTTHPGPRGGLWHKIGDNTIVLAGSDIQGMQYAVYDYSKMILGIDPLIYWTGHTTEKIATAQLFQFDNKIIAPPVVPLLVYFENDVDELANLKKPLLEYDWESYTQLIDALVRLRYNGIQFFDMLGRPEFFLRPTYKKIRPDYDINISYIEKMIDYAHDKGMKVQIGYNLT